MDRARRFLEQIKTKWARLRTLHAEARSLAADKIVPTLTVRDLSSAQQPVTLIERLKTGNVTLPYFIMRTLAGVLIIGSSVLGIGTSGQYPSFIVKHGSPFDITARFAGFSISEISISGNKEITYAEIMAASGITAANSLVTLNVADVQERLRHVPLVAEANVRKFYPNKLVISLVEREPYALWQKNGDVRVISADGTVIEGFNDARFQRLPHIVGEGANLRVKEYMALLYAVPALKDKIRAGTLISERRWNLKLANGVDVKLPEDGAITALIKLAQLDYNANVLDKDILSIDMRVPNRAAFRLTEASAQTRAEITAKKTIRKGKA